MKSMTIFALLLLTLLASPVAAAEQPNVFDVTSPKYSGSPFPKALTMAWTDACASLSPSTILLVPPGTYKLPQKTTFEGPCKSPIRFSLQGTLQAPKDRSQIGHSWVVFDTIDQLTLSGGGTFDGQGELTWNKDTHSTTTPVDVRFKSVTNAIISHINFIDSAKFHISIHDSENVTFRKVTITAPEDSPNTDGIHISKGSTFIAVVDSVIATGDDCVSIGDGTSHIVVSNVTCGPGHGISIGSLGRYPDEKPVSNITVINCRLIGTSNGARIKTWPDSPGESDVSDILYQDITMSNVKNPVIIDQYYCDKRNEKSCDGKYSSKVKISNVRFQNIKGTTLSPVAVKINCSRTTPCENVELADIDLKYSGDKKGESVTSQCGSVRPRVFSGVARPLACANLRDITIEKSSPPPIPQPTTPGKPSWSSSSSSSSPAPPGAAASDGGDVSQDGDAYPFPLASPSEGGLGPSTSAAANVGHRGFLESWKGKVVAVVVGLLVCVGIVPCYRWCRRNQEY